MTSTFSGFFDALRRLRQTRAGSMLFTFVMLYAAFSVLKRVGLDPFNGASAASLALLSLCTSLWTRFVVFDLYACGKYLDESKAEEIAELDNPVPYGFLRPLAHGAAMFMWFFCVGAFVETMSLSEPVGLFSGFNRETLLDICSMPSVFLFMYLAASFMYAARQAAVDQAVKRGLAPPEAETDESRMGRVERLVYRFYLRAFRPATEKVKSLAKRNRFSFGFAVFLVCMAVFGASGLFELLSMGAYDFRMLAAGSLLFSIWCAAAGYDMWRAYDQKPAERIEKGYPYGVVRPFVYGLMASLLFYVWRYLYKEARISESMSWASEHLTEAYDAHVAKIAEIYQFGMEEFIMLIGAGAATTICMLYARRRAQKKAAGMKTAERG